MFYVYVLKCPKAATVYIGFSADLRQRIKQHASHPMHRGWKLAYYEAYLDEKDARERERRLKHHGCGSRTFEGTYSEQPGTGLRKSGVTACLLHNESASYCPWRA